MRKQYIDKLVSMLGEAGLDAMLISPSAELSFFTGFSPMMCERFQALFVKADGTMFYLCNLLYEGEIRAHLDMPVYTWFDCDGMIPVVSGILREQGLCGKRIGVNSSAQAFNVLDIAEACDIRFVNGKPLLEEIRIHKTADELVRMQKSADIANACYEKVLHFIKPGITEADVRDFMFEEMQSHGGTNMWAIVASGPNSSYPHYCDAGRVLQKGDCIVLDWGCEYMEMQSDISRTIFLGSATQEQKEHYALSLRSTLAAEAAAVEGAFIPDIDAAARKVLDEKGLASSLINRTGHGIGHMGHEGPDIKTCNPRRLERGMCFSIEPGLYLPGVYGMRVEDIIAIGLDGRQINFNWADRDMHILPCGE